MSALPLPASGPARWLRRLRDFGRSRLLRRRSQALGVKAVQMLNAVLADAGVAVVVHDAEGRCLVCNDEAARVAGLVVAPPPGSSLVGRLPDVMLHGPFEPTDAETWQTPAGPRLFRVNRGRLPAHVPGEGEPHYLVARDVTEQRHAAERLVRNEQQLSLAMRGAALGLWDWQVVSGEVHVNERWAEMLGYRVEEIEPHLDSWRALVHPDDWAAIDASLLPHLRGDTDSYRCEHRLRHRDGHWIWVLDAGQVVERDAEGRALRALGIHLDVTDRRGAIDALERSRRELEVRVQERTRALAQASAEAQAASAAKSAFLANISHEIRTPMNAIVGMSRLLARSATDTEQGARIATIESAAAHLMTLIGDVLDLSKIEAGHMELEQLPLALPELLRQSLGLFGPQAQAKGIALRLCAAGLPERLLGDPTRLRQALLNLVANAVKFTDHGEVVLSVTQLPEEGDDAVRLRFEVSDTGPGFGAEVAGRLFSAFEQGDASIARRHGGTGLGLAITRRIAEMMGGKVGLSSQPGQGARFWFTARLLRDQRPRGFEEGQSLRLSAAERLRLRHHGKRVLLVEDNPVNQEIALAVLAQGALEVCVAPDGESALREYAAYHAFDAVLMDLHLPDMDGFEVTRRLQDAGMKSPVLALTASAMPLERAQSERLGMVAFLTKPLDPDALHEALLAVFAAARAL
ncbi:ATP-binding protein [Roseateles sp. NT4]|uniref:ATP-binding protein n=1 Tax=Roseateles sp. NT4 TaxID=3453715 RepID=UPI003EE907BC